MVTLLLTHGADVHACFAPYYWAPLFEAVVAGRYEISELLLTNGADPDIGDEDGDTPMLVALPRLP